MVNWHRAPLAQQEGVAKVCFAHYRKPGSLKGSCDCANERKSSLGKERSGFEVWLPLTQTAFLKHRLSTSSSNFLSIWHRSIWFSPEIPSLIREASLNLNFLNISMFPQETKNFPIILLKRGRLQGTLQRWTAEQ